MKILITFLSFWVCLGYSQGTGTITKLEDQKLIMADKVVRDIVGTHPDLILRTQFGRMFAEKKFYISFQSNRLPPEMASSLVSVNGQPVLVLEINPDFLLKMAKVNAADDKRYKQLVLYHEFTHINNHLLGKAKIVSTKFFKEDAEQRAKIVWNSEWYAVLAEWNLAKQMKAEHLCEAISINVKKWGEKRGFLEGFYLLLTSNSFFISSGSGFLKPTWRKMYEEAKKQM